MPRAIAWMLFFAFINLSWMFFRAGSVSDVWELLCQLRVGGLTVSAELYESLCQPFIINIFVQLFTMRGAVLILYLTALMLSTVAKNAKEQLSDFKPTVWNLLGTAALLVVGMLSISGVQSFLYSNF